MCPELSYPHKQQGTGNKQREFVKKKLPNLGNKKPPIGQ